MSAPHKSVILNDVIKLNNMLGKKQEVNISENRPPPQNILNTSTTSTTSKTSVSSFFGGGSGFFAKSSPIDTSKEPLGSFYEKRKKIIFGEINVLEDEAFISQFLLSSQKKINSDYVKIAASVSGFFSDVPQKAYTFSLSVKENILNFCLVIKLYLLNNCKDRAIEIFLLMCKENKKKIEFIHKKVNLYCKKAGSAMRKFTPPIAKILLNLLSILIKLSVKFCKTSLQNFFCVIYIKTLFSLIEREIKAGFEYKNDLKYNRAFVYANCLFDSAIFFFYNYYPLSISIQIFQHILEFYNDNSREKNNYELVLMMKTNFNCGFFYFVDEMYKESAICLNAAKDLISDLIQNNLNGKDDEKEFLSDLGANSFLNEEKNSLFCLKMNNQRISKIHINLNKFLKENAKKASSVVLGSKKNELKLPLLLDQIKRKITMEADLILCQIEMHKKNYKGAWEQINYILKNNTIKDDFDTRGLSKRKKIGVNKTFKSLKTYQNIRTKPLIEQNNENNEKSVLTDKDLNLIYLLLEKIEQELIETSIDEKSFALKKKNNTLHNLTYSSVNNNKLTSSNYTNYTNFKEMEKFFIFICNLSIFQLKILNETQPKYSKKRDDLPIIFSTPFRDCLTNAQRMDLDELETMSLSRYIILIDTKKEIEPENLDYKYMKYKIKTPLQDSDDEKEKELEVQISFDEETIKKRGRNRSQKLIRGIYSLSTNEYNNSSIIKKYTGRKISNASKKLSFDNIEEYDLKLELALQKIKTENNKKFLFKHRKHLKYYFDGLNTNEKEIFINSPNLLKKMLEKVEKKMQKGKANTAKNIKIKKEDKKSYDYSYEISQTNSYK